MAIIDVVKFDGLKSRDWIVYKHPSDQLVLGTQLTVKEGQAAIFMKDGKIADIFEPGRYTLSTDNLPLLRGLVNIPFGGTTPFPAEVYFLNTLTKLDIPWGTADPIQLIDPQFGVKLRIRAYGQMGLKLRNYKTFFSELIGAMPKQDAVSYDKIYDYYRSLVISRVKVIIAENIIRDKISALEITLKLEEISDKTKEKISGEFEKYGLETVSFIVQSINFPDEDFKRINEILEQNAEFNILGDARYTTKRSFDVYEGAANNQSGVAGAFVSGGLGLGVGMGVARNMNQQMPNPTEMAVCPHCGESSVAGSKFCSSCGKPMVIKKVTCPKCGNPVAEGSKFCNECGTSLLPRQCECGNMVPPGSRFCSECGRKMDQ